MTSLRDNFRINFRSPAALCRFFLTTILGLTLDLWSKAYAFSTLVIDHYTDAAGQWQPQSKQCIIIPGWLEFHVTANRGAVFGIGQGHQWLFVIISIGAILFLTYLFGVSRRQRFYQFVLGLLLAGVLGNMYDRLAYGYVRDFIYILPRWQVFPWIFNVADIMLCTGVGLILLQFLLAKGKNPLEDAQPMDAAQEQNVSPPSTTSAKGP